MRDIIKKTFDALFTNTDLTLLGISSERTNKRVIKRETISAFNKRSKKAAAENLRYTAALKQGKLLIPVSFNGNESTEDIKKAFYTVLSERNVQL